MQISLGREFWSSICYRRPLNCIGLASFLLGDGGHHTTIRIGPHHPHPYPQLSSSWHTIRRTFSRWTSPIWCQWPEGMSGKGVDYVGATWCRNNRTYGIKGCQYKGVLNPSIKIKHHIDPPGCSSLKRDREKQMFIASLLSFVDCKIA